MNGTSRSPGTARRTVLVVDDELINRIMLSQMVSGYYDVLTAENGLEAWRVLEQYGDAISIVLLDIMMPEMTGLELLEKMMASERYARIPVIMMTSDQESELRALRLGAMDFIKKPYDDLEIILARIQRIIEFVEDKRIIRDFEHDPLTGLYTESFFQEYCRRELLYGREHPLDMIALNVDRFRLINEVCGKGFGNQVLCAIADGIREVAGERACIGCRVNADLFFLLVEHTGDPDQIRQTVLRHVQPLNTQVSVFIRMGVCSNVDRKRPVEWFIEAALSACNAIRGKYAENIRFYDDELHKLELRNEQLLNEMREGLRTGQFVVYYQPKFDVTGPAPVLYSAEALVRWNHPELGFLSPAGFIPLFEENGLISELDAYVWNETAAQIRRWRDQYGVTLPVSVNVSRMDFFAADLPGRLQKIVEQNGISVKDLVLEITESAYSQNMDQVLAVVARLREQGFRIEMDDFGSGYSSLSMLTVLPIDALKIDMKFVKGLVNNANGYFMVQLVVQMAKCLSVPAIVEGVETREQYEMMKQAGCDVIQGYYFSQPIDNEKFTGLLAQNAEAMAKKGKNQ